ncbi:MAG: hypothetical protein KDI79_26155 [Anaerolineae bacterium]|nr:hypothetical protein [Anaerolineae bacterium]
MTFYLNHLIDVANDSQQIVTLSPSAIQLCLTALISAQYRHNWVQDLTELDDSEWDQARAFVKTAIDELTQQAGGVIDGGSA